MRIGWTGGNWRGSGSVTIVHLCHGVTLERESVDWRRHQIGADDEFREDRPKDASQVLLRSIFKKRGVTLDYTYDFGDGNQVCITFLKRVNAPHLRYFDSAGPNMVEDSRCTGGAEGVWGVLRAGPAHAEYEHVVRWLWESFHLMPVQVLHEPSQEEIYGKVFHLLKVIGSCPRSSFSLMDSWMDYVTE